MSNDKKMTILFLCTGNSCRSQMAEGLTKSLKGEIFDAFSAGIVAKGVDPRAVKAMAQIGIDISDHSSKALSDIQDRNFDYVVTVCGNAKESCPVFPGEAKIVHKGFDDPPAMAASASKEEEAMTHYRRVRDEIKAFVDNMPNSLEELIRDPLEASKDALVKFMQE